MLNLDLYKKIIEEDSITPLTSKYLEVTKDKIKVLGNCFIQIDKELEEDIVISNETFKMLASFPIYIESNENPEILYKFDLKIPYTLTFNYDEMEKNSDFIEFKLEENKYLVDNNLYLENIDEASTIINKLFLGKFNDVLKINYEELVPKLMEILETHKVSGFQSLIYELMISVLTRNVKDVTQEFRLIADEKENYNNFQMINIRDIPRNHSPFSALASEGISQGIITAISNKRSGYTPHNITPQEKITLGKL